MELWLIISLGLYLCGYVPLAQATLYCYVLRFIPFLVARLCHLCLLPNMAVLVVDYLPDCDQHFDSMTSFCWEW